MKSHTIIAKPFIEKADRIEKCLDCLINKKLSEKSLKDIEEIEKKYLQIQIHCIPIFKAATGQEFPHPNLFFFVFLYQELSAVFNEAQQLRSNLPEISQIETEFEGMKNFLENRMTLAYIGDAALEICVIPYIWQQSTKILPSSEILHKKRGEIVENSPLSQYWDALSLFDSTILKQHNDENAETKGSYMEAVFGIIYLEHGVNAVENALQNLIRYSEKNPTTLS
jgi:23S rRNA maturation mini-RNase III